MIDRKIYCCSLLTSTTKAQTQFVESLPIYVKNTNYRKVITTQRSLVG